MEIVVGPVILFAGLTLLSALGWWFMARRPNQWAAIVERENNFWRDKGIISAAFAEKMKRWETGTLLKKLAALAACIGLIGFLLAGTVLVRVMVMEHHKLRMPFNPVLRQPQPKRPLPTPAPVAPPKRR